jgi:hypothetical protein
MIIGEFAAAAGKRIVKTPYFGRLGNSRKIPGNYILPED